MLGKTAAMPMPAPQRQRQDVFYCPSGYQSEYTLFHTSRVIKYVFLDGSQNIVPTPAAAAAHTSPALESQVGYLESTKGYYYPFIIPDHSLASSYWAPDLERLPIFITLSKSQEKLSGGWGRPLISRDRLPIFRQLCGELAGLAVHRRENLVVPKAAKEEMEKPEDLEAVGLGNLLDSEDGEEKEGESGSCMIQTSPRERETQL
ncbi:uncharacterized protein LOC117060136 [Lacerta agilis]|uniref:uncharacterized protein LOC117060136 n=1 Tax=Lacerta agilis TaxID=80427 RepID=UPI001419B167|nr:uncharacterized protein LOC117060136 [Lacerta agilis]